MALMPATEPMLITRAGFSALAERRSSGSSCWMQENTEVTLSCMTFSQPDTG
ncbi:Uncharacterised protein [Pseudomonas aeruginosa]|nr:hypothetical protein PAERUG_E16_London_17_VIM_2_04_14_04187 [Pseudomonas aeruginosa]SPY91372.1 Uncharacterised protein [Pseudomonas aeruginosa]